MKINTTTTALGLALALALGAGCTPEAAVEDAQVADADSTLAEPVDAVDPLEPAAGIGDGAVAGAGGLGTWDGNSDSMLDDGEFRARFNDGDWYGDWDGDKDGNVSAEEFNTVRAGWGDAPGGVDENGLVDVWDADEDGLLSNDEVTTGAYSTWDRDGNRMIDTAEYEAGSRWFGW